MILVCGETLFDLFETSYKGHRPDDDEVLLKAVAGGSPFNVAVGLARLHRAVALSTTIGRDSLGHRAMSILAAEDIDTSFVRRSGATPLAFVDVGPDGVPSYSFAGIDQAIYHPEPALLPDAPVDAIHVGSLAIVSSTSADALLEIVKDYAPRAFISLDPNIRLKANPDVGRWCHYIEQFRAHAHLVKVSEEDLHTIYGAAVDPLSIAEGWLDGNTQLVVVTRGEGGASLFSRHGRINVSAVPVKVADTVGAGDSFQAALLCWLDERGFLSPDAIATMTEDNIHDMGSFSVFASSLTCSRNGPNLPFRLEMAVSS